MKRIVLALGMVLTAAALSAEAQTADADKWTLPRTTDGRPDLQGVWTTQTFTPLQRPDRYAGKEFLTDAEAAELTKLLTQDGIDPLAGRIFAASDEERAKLEYEKFYVPERKAAGLSVPAFEAVSDDMRSRSQQRVFNEEVEKWMAELREKSRIEIYRVSAPAGPRSTPVLVSTSGPRATPTPRRSP